MKLTKRNAKKILKKYLSDNKSKYRHSIRVAKTCKLLARKFNVSIEEAIIAGLLHDIGKSISANEMLNFCSRNNLKLYDYDIFYNPKSLHGTISAFLVEKNFPRVNDREKLERILKAVKNHTAGASYMSDLDKVVYLADKIEPKKEEDEDFLDIILKDVNSIDEAIIIVINRKIDRANKNGKIYNPHLDALKETILDSINRRESRREAVFDIPQCIIQTPKIPNSSFKEGKNVIQDNCMVL